MAFQKLKDLKQFTVKTYKHKIWSKWDDVNKKFIKSDVYMTGLSPKYEVETEGGALELSQGQLGQMLVAAFNFGQSNIIGRTFTVKTNGEVGEAVRYFINLLNPSTSRQSVEVQGEPKAPTEHSEPVLPF